jgi:sigma-B regulation protein RsbU (phosphoserine phosphatase)
LFVGTSSIRPSDDTTTAAATVTAQASGSAEGSRERRWFLGRTYLPLGDWSGPRGSRRGGSVELGVATTAQELSRSLAGSLGGVAANFPPVAILVGLAMILSMIEGFLVRSGRSIVQAVVDEAATLRGAAERIGAGDLETRLPVRGKDEFSVVAASFNAMAANLKRQREELAAAERLEEDLAVAREIQQRFLPQQSPEIEGLDVAGMSLPSREVGGDLYYWFPHEDGSLGVTLGDVSGKSVPAALLMSNVLAALRAQALLRVEPAESVARVNRFISGQVEPGRFVTLFYAELDPARGALSYASAGHNPPLLLRAGGGIEWLREGGVPLGVVSDASYGATAARFDPGDTLIVYSDGVTEAEGPSPSSAGAPLYGEERLAEVAEAQRGQPARAMLDALLASVQAFANGTRQADDITVVVVRRG